VGVFPTRGKTEKQLRAVDYRDGAWGKGLAGARVLLLNQVLEMGGAERQALYLARHLKEEIGCEVHFWGLGVPGLVMERCREWGIPCRVVPVNWRGGHADVALGALQFLGECRKLHPDIMLPYTNPANVLCGLTWRSVGAAVCVWNQRDGGLHRLPRALEDLAVKSTPYFVANSVAGAGFLTSQLGVADGSIRVIHNGVQLPAEVDSREEARERLDIAGDCLVACMVANLHEGKDHETLIRAWCQVRASLTARGRDSTLLLVGHDYGLQAGLQRLAGDLGLTSRDIRFMGQLTEPEAVFSASDLCVHSTKSDKTEGTPNAVLEAMAMGLPVVGTGVAGLRETLGESARAHLSPPGDADGLAARILRVLLDEELRLREGETNRRRVRMRFSLESMFARMTTLIASAAQERCIAIASRGKARVPRQSTTSIWNNGGSR
jgi:glycosyltransferase involved in cell wall biosynthesis